MVKQILLLAGICGSIASPICMTAQNGCSSLLNTIGEYNRNNEVYTAEDSSNADNDTIESSNKVIDEVTDTVAEVPLMVALPLKEISINSPFGVRRDPMNRRKTRMHNGLDLKARFEDVYSMLPGIVTAASYSSGGGYYVTVDHGVCSTSYLHLSKINVVNGQHVKAGDIIAVSGNTGKRTTGPHLHLACKWSDTGKYFDPKILLRFVTQELMKLTTKLK